MIPTNQPECTALHIALLCQAGGDNESNQKYQEEVYLADIQKNDQFYKGKLVVAIFFLFSNF